MSENEFSPIHILSFVLQKRKIEEKNQIFNTRCRISREIRSNPILSSDLNFNLKETRKIDDFYNCIPYDGKGQMQNMIPL